MNGSRSIPPRHGDTSSLDALSRTIEGLEARIEGLMGTAGRDSRPRLPPEREPRSERDIYSGRDARPDQASRLDPLAEIRQRQRVLEASRERNRATTAPAATEPRRAAPPVPPVPAYRAPEAARPAPAAQPDFAIQDIAKALVSLRLELKQDISDSVGREVSALRSEIRSIKSVAGDQRFAEDIRADLSRLSNSISQLGNLGASRGETDGLRAEFEDLRALMDGLAREESVQRMESRWSGLDEKLHGFDTHSLQEELVSLAYRLDDIKTQLGDMSATPAILALEDKLLMIASALEQLGDRIQPNDDVMAEQFAGLDMRLDEISRAIVASSRASTGADPAVMQRLENRIAALGDQIDMIGRDAMERADPTAGLSGRIEALTQRIEEMAHVAAAGRLEERLEQLSMLMERSHKAPPAPELTGFLADISRKIDALDHGSVNDVLAERLDMLARRIDQIDFQPQAATVDSGAFRRLEDRLSDIAARLDETAAAPANDHHALKALEDQIAHLSVLVSQPRSDAGELPATYEHRMAALEDYMSTNDEYIIEAARQAAEAVVEAYSRNGSMQGSAPAAADMSALNALADDLRHLEDFSRSSEERTHRTFEALHDTLVQIAGRLDQMDSGSSSRVQPEPARAAAPPARTPSAPIMPRANADFMAQPVIRDAPAYAQTPNRNELPFAEIDFDQELAAYPPRDTVSNAVATARTADIVLPAGDMDLGDEARPLPDKKSLLAALGKRLIPGRKAQPAAKAERTLVDPTPSIAPEDMIPTEEANQLLEPGSGAPDVKKILERVRANQSAQRAGGKAQTDADRSDYIAAARRAAQAAAQDVDHTQKTVSTRDGSQQTSAIAKYRRPVLLAVGAILLAIMAMPLVKTLTSGEEAPPPAQSTSMQESSAVTPTPSIAATTAPTETAPATDTGAGLPATTPADPNSADARLTDTTPLAGEPAAGFTAPTETTPAAPTTTAETTETAAVEDTIVVPETIEPKSLADAAKAGDPAALFEIGARFTEGRGQTINLAEAAKWYKLSADKGFAPAEYRLANLYEKGTGVERDIPAAQRYYQLAADKGNASAMHNLAVLYATGTDGKPDYDNAVRWFVKAADLGVADSQFNLAILYARGNGVPQNLEESYKWFAIAAKGGDKDAALKRDEVANAMKPEQLANARALVELWKVQPLNPDSNSVNVPDEWVGKGLKTASVDMKKAIRNIQAILNNNGFDAGAPDGELGQKTVAAIKAFQSSIGMEPTGRMNDQLVKELLARNK